MPRRDRGGEGERVGRECDRGRTGQGRAGRGAEGENRGCSSQYFDKDNTSVVFKNKTYFQLVKRNQSTVSDTPIHTGSVRSIRDDRI